MTRHGTDGNGTGGQGGSPVRDAGGNDVDSRPDRAEGEAGRPWASVPPAEGFLRIA